MLVELGKKHGTDKVEHGFLPIYARYFNTTRSLVHRVLEIGIDQGCSLRMWSEYFPKAIVEAWDLKEYEPGTFGPRTSTWVVDQSDRNVMLRHLNRLGLTPGCGYDVIIDDGSHRMLDQQVSFGLLWRFLNPGGVYVVEDLHTSLPLNPCEWVGGGCKVDFSNSTLEAMKRLQQRRQMTSVYMLDPEMQSISREHIFCEVVDVLGDGRHITSVVTKALLINDSIVGT